MYSNNVPFSSRSNSWALVTSAGANLQVEVLPPRHFIDLRLQNHGSDICISKRWLGGIYGHLLTPLRVSRNILQKVELPAFKQVGSESYCDFGKSINVASFVFTDWQRPRHLGTRRIFSSGKTWLDLGLQTLSDISVEMG